MVRITLVAANEADPNELVHTSPLTKLVCEKAALPVVEWTYWTRIKMSARAPRSFVQPLPTEIVSRPEGAIVLNGALLVGRLTVPLFVNPATSPMKTALLAIIEPDGVDPVPALNPLVPDPAL